MENGEEKLEKVSQNMYEIMNHLYSLEQTGVQRQTNFQESFFRKELTLSKSFEMIISSININSFEGKVDSHIDI